MSVLYKEGNLKYEVVSHFEHRFLDPVQQYVSWKLNNEWDDYNEFYHATQLMENLKKTKNVWFDSHTLTKEGKLKGFLLIVGGKITSLEDKYTIQKEEESVLLKYFHIVEKGKGYGSFWLKSVILPHYSSRGFKNLYVNSSHPDSFPFYSRLGSKIADYTKASDNGLYQRSGNSFLINLNTI